ncbi:ficolin-1-A-like [Anopheles maculipalpis]|uniref:ficolin-1-A-like n=1 Tax=Anopheles maculipalpis TaxID=1496333 RepID=UPI0021592EAF|nr:ficolin-1-A-like [Anopheles maculipalpis]
MKCVNVIATAVLISVMASQLQATTTPTGFGFELLQTQLEAFESRMKKQYDDMQQSIKLNRIELETIKRNTAESLMNQDSGVYFVNLKPSSNESFAVYRDGSNNHGFGSNWTVFQRRFDGSVDFDRNWTEYKQGFGDLRREHWLGLEKLKTILDTERHELLIVMEDFEGVTAFAKYDDFKIGNESEMYKLNSLGTYSGIVGDSFSSQLNHKFATSDQDNAGKCADIFKGGGWYSSCYQSNLNGIYLKGGKQGTNKGIHWYYFRGYHYSLKATKMMIRPYALRSHGCGQ